MYAVILELQDNRVLGTIDDDLFKCSAPWLKCGYIKWKVVHSNSNSNIGIKYLYDHTIRFENQYK